MQRLPGQFPTDAEVEQRIADANVDTIIAMMVQATGFYEARRRVAEFIITLRGHHITRDNTQILPQGVEARCDRCGMKLLVPQKPRPGELGVYGRATELNCPAARRGRPAEGYADMPPELYELFLNKVGPQKPWEQPTSFEPPKDRSAEVAARDKLEAEATHRFEAQNEAAIRKIRGY